MLQAALPARFVNIDDDTPLLLPPDLRDWLTKDHLVHFIMDAVAQIDVSGAKVNERGTGSEKYPPAMMMSLLIFCCGPAHRHQRLCRHQTHASPAQRARPGKARLPARADARSQRQRAHGHRTRTAAGRASYKLRQQTIEPVFGIIKSAMGFRSFSMRGLQKAELEWTLVSAS
jgi:hypothetical protein